MDIDTPSETFCLKEYQTKYCFMGSEDMNQIDFENHISNCSIDKKQLEYVC